MPSSTGWEGTEWCHTSVSGVLVDSVTWKVCVTSAAELEKSQPNTYGPAKQVRCSKPCVCVARCAHDGCRASAVLTRFVVNDAVVICRSPHRPSWLLWEPKGETQNTWRPCKLQRCIWPTHTPWQPAPLFGWCKTSTSLPQKRLVRHLGDSFVVVVVVVVVAAAAAAAVAALLILPCCWRTTLPLGVEFLTGHNLILVGGPEYNTWTSRIANASRDTAGCDMIASNTECRRTQHLYPGTHVLRRPDVTFVGVHAFELGQRQYNEPGTGLIFTAPLWHQRKGDAGGAGLALVIAGTDAAGFRLAMQLVRALVVTTRVGVVTLLYCLSSSWTMTGLQALPTIPPMTRAPFSNLVPDFVVLGPRAKAWGWAG